MNEIRDDCGRTIDQDIATSVNELDDLGVCLQELIDSGRLGFRLSGDTLKEYLRRTLHAVIAAGGRLTTVPGDPDDDPWLFTTRYGTTPDEIVENVIAAGLPREGHLEWGSFRFASPKAAAFNREELRRQGRLPKR